MFNGIDNQAFEYMTAAADKTNVDLFSKPDRLGSKDVHNMLMAAGMTPAYGNIADAADAALYALEGEFGNAAWSMAAAIPFIGQWVSAKRALKVAKKSGEEMVTLFTGVKKINDPKTMVKNKRVVGKFTERFNQKSSGFGNEHVPEGRKLIDTIWGKEGMGLVSVPENVNVDNLLFTTFKKTFAKGYKDADGMLLEFEVPISWVNKHGRDALGESLSHKNMGWGTSRFKEVSEGMVPSVLFPDGLPVEFLKSAK